MREDTIVNEVMEGDTLPDLDNGYVFEVADAASNISWNSAMSGAFHSDMVLIGFHDAEGNENYLILCDTHPITIERED